MLNIVNHQRNVNSNKKISSYTSKWLSSKRTQVTNTGDDVEKREPYTLLVGM